MLNNTRTNLYNLVILYSHVGWLLIPTTTDKSQCTRIYSLCCTSNINFFFAATEYRIWLFYYSFPFMKGVLNEDYFQHYALLVGGIILLSGRSISPQQLEVAAKFLMHFVEMFDAYYG